MNLAALLLRAADILAEREEADSGSDDSMVPDASSRAKSKKLMRRPAPPAHDEVYSGSGSEEEDGHPQRHGGARQGPRKAGRGPLQHNEVEKRRRAYLAACYVELKAMLPTIANSKASNVSILRTAVDKIQALEAQEHLLDSERAALYRQREQLLARTARRRGHAMNVLLEASESASEVASSSGDSDSGHEMLVPDASRRSLSPDMSEDMSYDHAGSSLAVPTKLGQYAAQPDAGGGAMRRRNRSRPSRFM